MSHFLVFGRPRSRTAWVANFLTSGIQSFCLHEGMATAASPMELLGQMKAASALSTGNADTGMIHTPREILRFFPDARLVVLTGGRVSWARFADQHRLPSWAVRKVDDDYGDTRDLLEGRALFVDIHQLMSDPDVAEKLWTHCTGGHFDLKRYLMLRDLNVQVMQESLALRVASRLKGR